MGRKVEGITLDLTRIPASGEFILEDLIVHEEDLPTYESDEYAFLKEKYSDPCSFCGIKSGRKHFDHKNMFDKTGCVGKMIKRKYNIVKIKAEIDKCQLLCVPCHKKVTAYEYSCGFIAQKRYLNKSIRAGMDVTSIRMQYFDNYRDKMGPFYEQMRGSRGKLDENCDTGLITLTLPI
jgi:hypothetical protein